MDPSPRGRNDSRVAAWARVSSASSRWYSASSATSGARCSRTPRPRCRSSRGPNAAPARPGRPRPSRPGRHPGRRGAPPTPRRSPGPAPRSGHRHRARRRSASTATRERQPTRRAGVRSRGRPWSGRQPGRGGPVTGLLGDVVGGSEDPQLLGLHAALTRATRSRNSRRSATVRNSGPIAASSSNPPSSRSSGSAYVLDIGQSKHRPPTALRPQNPLSTRDSSHSTTKSRARASPPGEAMARGDGRRDVRVAGRVRVAGLGLP